MKKKLTHNLGLKIASVLIAISLWIIAININDPITQRVYTVVVQLQNLNSLTNAGKYVEVLDNTNTIRVTVRASRSVFSDFSEKNIVAVADVSKMTDDYRLPIELSSSKTDGKIESISADKDYVDVIVENNMKLQKRIMVNVANEPEEGYILGSISTDQNAVIISGPESVVSKIASTAVEINVDGATNDVNITLPVHLYDAEGHEIDDAKLTKSVNEVFTTAAILQTKEVSIEYSTTGEPAEGYIFTGNYIREPEKILIAAKPAVLKNINTIVVNEPIGLEGTRSSVQQEFEIKQYLPEGCILADSQDDSTVRATAQVEKEEVRIIELPIERIALTNIPQGYQARLRGAEDTVTVRLAGLPSALENVDETSLYGTVDVSKYVVPSDGSQIAEGSHYPAAAFELPEYVHLQDTVTIHIVLNKE